MRQARKGSNCSAKQLEMLTLIAKAAFRNMKTTVVRSMNTVVTNIFRNMNTQVTSMNAAVRNMIQ